MINFSPLGEVNALGFKFSRGINAWVLVLANKCGVEASAVYTGTSVILRVGYGKVDVLGILGMGEDGLLVADTEQAPELRWNDILKGLESVDVYGGA